MPWLKLDDGFITNPKLLGLGSDAKVLYVWALGFAARELTNGFIATKALRSIMGLALIADQNAPDELVAAGLWERVEGGYQIHDYLDYNPSREAVLKERESARKRMFARTSPELRPNFGDPVPGPVPVPIVSMDEPEQLPPQPDDDDPVSTLPISEQRKILALLDVGISHGMGAELAQKCSLKRIQDVIVYCRSAPGLTSPTGRVVNMLRSGESIPRAPLPANKGPGKGSASRESHYDEAELAKDRKPIDKELWARNMEGLL